MSRHRDRSNADYTAAYALDKSWPARNFNKKRCLGGSFEQGPRHMHIGAFNTLGEPLED
jgi:hypothetical protein